MNPKQRPEPERLARMTVSEIVTTWPETAALFHNLEMICPGCAVAPFCDLTYAAGAHGVPLEELLLALDEVIAAGLVGESQEPQA
jgi:hybrid cluster-associated redox disulfide protein